MSLTPEILEELRGKLGEKHIMLSYNWGVQDLVKTVYEYVDSKGIPVWMDIMGGVTGNINAAMAKGVEGAVVICPFMTEDYQNSESCELELNYAKDCKVQIVPCMAQEQCSDGNQYRQSGWLGVITAGKLWTDFRGLEDAGRIAEQCDALLIEIANKLNVDTRGGFKPAKPPTKPAQPKPKPPPPAQNPTPAPAPVQEESAIESTTTIQLESHKYAYKEVKMTGVTGMKVKNQLSKTACTLGDSFGFDGEKIWVHKGCRAEFYVTTCQTAPGGKLSGKMCIRGHHGSYIGATSGKGATCKSKNPGVEETVDVVTIKGDTVALKSSFGKYLSAQKNHSLQWNRDAAQGWEHFKVGWVDQTKFTLKSFHGRYLSAQANGNLDCNREKAQAWEHFTVTQPASPAAVPVPAASSAGLKNLALKKEHVYQSSEACGGNPKRAVDGNTDGVYSNKGVTHTDPSKDKGLAWWHVNLGAWYQVRTIRVWNRIECAERLNGAHVYVHKKYIGQVKQVSGKQMYEFPAHDYNTNSVTVCLIATKAPLSLAQVEVFGTGQMGPQLVNVALSKPCFQSSVACGGDPNRAVNGKEFNLYDMGNTTHTCPKKDGKRAWWFVELGARYRIYEINILNRAECAERIDGAQVFVDDRHVHTIKFTPGVWWYHIPTPGSEYGCKIGVTLNTGAPLSLCEVLVMSDGFTQ